MVMIFAKGGLRITLERPDGTVKAARADQELSFARDPVPTAFRTLVYATVGLLRLGFGAGGPTMFRIWRCARMFT